MMMDEMGMQARKRSLEDLLRMLGDDDAKSIKKVMISIGEKPMMDEYEDGEMEYNDKMGDGMGEDYEMGSYDEEDPFEMMLARKKKGRMRY